MSRRRPAARAAGGPVRGPAGPTRGAGIAMGLALLVAVVYAPVRSFGFVNFDDPQYVAANPAVLAGLGWDGVRWAFSATHAGNWHPLTWLSHMLDVSLFGADPGAHHVVNVVFHAANTLLLCLVLVRLTGAAWRSAAVAALFAVHPLHVESVAWIAERKDVLSTLFLLLTLLAWTAWARSGRWPNYVTAVVLFALGLMAKPMLVTLPFVLLLLDHWPLRRRGARIWIEKVPLLALAAASSVVTYVVQQQAGAVKALDALPLEHRLANAAVGYVEYVVATVWPSGLAAIYPYDTSLPAWQLIGALAVLGAMSLAAWRTRARAPWCLIGWLWFLGTLVPVIGLVQVGSQPLADRYAYIPSVGLFIVAIWGVAAMPVSLRRTRLVLQMASVAVIVAFGVVARDQVQTWRDSLTLWRHAASVTTANYRAHTNLGHALAAAGQYDEAIAQYRTALGIKADFVEASNWLGEALAATGQTTAAIAEYRRALDILPTFYEARQNLGLALAAAGDEAGALREFTEAVRLRPDDAGARSNLGIALVQAGRLEDAIAAFRNALSIDPASDRARLNLATAYRDRADELAEAGRVDDALASLAQAVALVPRDPELHYRLGALLARKGLVDEAAKEFRLVLQIDAAHTGARRALAAIGR